MRTRSLDSGGSSTIHIGDENVYKIYILFFMSFLCVRHGRNWAKVTELVPGRTIVQIRSHAQKHFIKMERGGRGDMIPPRRTLRRKKSKNAPKKAPYKTVCYKIKPKKCNLFSFSNIILITCFLRVFCVGPLLPTPTSPTSFNVPSHRPSHSTPLFHSDVVDPAHTARTSQRPYVIYIFLIFYYHFMCLALCNMLSVNLRYAAANNFCNPEQAIVINEPPDIIYECRSDLLPLRDTDPVFTTLPATSTSGNTYISDRYV